MKYLTERYLRLQDGTFPHMGVRDGDVSPFVVLSGNPDRVEKMKGHLTQPQGILKERGFLIYSGTFKDVPITIASSGIGAPSVAIAVEELGAAGGKVIIRAGSCASIHKDADVGSMIIATSAVRDEGTSSYYAPSIYPAVADHKVVEALCQAAQTADAEYRAGIIRSTDSFYEGERKDEIINTWSVKHVLAFEMEASALFTIASVLGLRSGAILVPGSNLITGRSTYQGNDIEQYRQGVERMIELVFESIYLLSNKPS